MKERMGLRDERKKEEICIRKKKTKNEGKKREKIGRRKIDDVVKK